MKRACKIDRADRPTGRRGDGAHLPRKQAHDGQRGHIQGDASRRLEQVLVHLVSAADDVARPARGLHDEALVVELLQHLTDDLADALQRLEIVLRLLVILVHRLALIPHCGATRRAGRARGEGRTM